jgi:valyl-tRNA synthetase
MSELPKQYDPRAVEGPRYERWESDGRFAPSGEGDPFCIVLPPPNVTGVLHLGHALDHSIQDALVRRERMRGRNTLWLPGTDHAGIATQNVVERQLAEEGKSRHDLGRDAFVERVWDWKNESGGTITRQMRRLGDSVDWSRERFTMDEGLSRAVREIFVRLFEDDIIFRGERITNWCVRCHSAISDIEVDHEEVDGELVQLTYPLTDGSGGITIATTRVETMLADTAVAVHPDDDRYTDLVGKTVTLPLVGREIPIIADEAVESDFGTGALKVTPAHDQIDFEIGQRHGLDAPSVVGLDGTITSEGGRFAGMERFEARKAVLEALRAEGVVGEEQRPFPHPVGHCSRCKTEIEPLLSEQWFVRAAELAKEANAAIRGGQTTFVPKRYERNYFDWMDDARDWCISRQLWWGHRIPVWTCEQGHRLAYREDPSACDTCGSSEIEQDPDVLDTWFSSALWPFSTLGWPDQTEDLQTWYPTAVLVTGYDIITFWVSRMMMMGAYAMGNAPFSTVLIHGMVRDGHGKKMSKSFGNALDPLDLIDRYGADALRMTLTRGATLGSDVPLDEKWIEGDRNFCTKLWNLARFLQMQRDPSDPIELPPTGRLTLADRWILSRLDALIEETNRLWDDYDLAHAAQLVRAFAWDEFADWAVEWAKGRLYSDDEQAKRDQAAVLALVFERTLRLLHPFMPFITEELWTTLTGGETVMDQPWPESLDARDPESEDAFGFAQSVIVALRRFKADHEIAPSKKPDATAVIADAADRSVIETEMERVRALGGWGNLLLTGSEPEAAGATARLVLTGAAILVPLEGLLDIEEEKTRLSKQRDKHASEIARIEGKLSNEAFVSKAPQDVVETQRQRLAEEQDLLGRIEAALADLA